MEIEIRAFVDDFDSVRDKLCALNCSKLEEVNLQDSWFCAKEADKFSDISMNKPGSIGIRVRLQDNAEPELNIKTIIKKGDHNIFQESSTNFKDAKNMEKMLHLLGLKKFCVISKRRETFQKGEMKINLENIENFPPCIEIEIISDSNFDEKLEQINKMMDSLGIIQRDRITKSITSLFMEKFAFKQAI